MAGNYKENPEIKEFPDLDKVVERFKDTGKIKADNQKVIYEAISRNWCIGKSVVDAGCGIGIGTNILAREAVGAYGIDINEQSVEFARQMFGGPKIKFDVANICEEMPRPTATFDVVVCVEVIEHVKDFNAVLNGLKKFYNEKRRTVFFISSPNRNNEKIKNDQPRNKHHVREWTAGEFYEALTKHFKAVVMYSGTRLSDFTKPEEVDGGTTETPILAKCELPNFEIGEK